MKFEVLSHGFEVQVSRNCNSYCVVAPRFKMSNNVYLDVGGIKLARWNTVWCCFPEVDSSSMCSKVAISSNQLYLDELVRFAGVIGAYLAPVTLPDLNSIHPRYFTEVFSGIIKAAIPTATAVAILNSESCFSGKQHPVFTFPLSEVPHPLCAERRANWLTDYSN